MQIKLTQNINTLKQQQQQQKIKKAKKRQRAAANFYKNGPSIFTLLPSVILTSTRAWGSGLQSILLLLTTPMEGYHL